MKKLLSLLFIVTTIQVTAQPLKKWLNFDGSDDYVSFGDTSVLKPTGALTVELWAYNSDWTAISGQSFISNTETGGYNIWVESGSNKIEGLVYLNGSYCRAGVNGSALSVGWHHFALTCDDRSKLIRNNN